MIMILSIFSFFSNLCGKGDSEDYYVKLSHKISDQYSRDMLSQHGFRQFGSGGGFYYNVDHISIIYFSEKMVTKDEARKLYLEVVEGLIARYNADIPIRPYLSKYPFDQKNMDITIRFNPQSPLTYISYSPYGDVIIFHVRKGLEPSKYDTTEEPYEEAYKIVFGHERKPECSNTSYQK